MMPAVIDTSSLISLAWSGRLPLLRKLPLRVSVIESVYAEAVTAGRAAGHADAVAIETAMTDVAVIADPPGANTDLRVAAAGAAAGLTIANDVALGRRAKSLGSRWLRTADLVLLAHRVTSIDRSEAEASLWSLHDAGRITSALLDSYLEALDV